MLVSCLLKCQRGLHPQSGTLNPSAFRPGNFMAPQLFLDLGMGGLSGMWHLQRCIPYLGGQDEVKGSTPCNARNFGEGV